MLKLALTLGALACPLHPASLDVALGERALPGLPPDLARQVAKHPQAFAQGAQAAAAYPGPLHLRGGKNAVEEAIFQQCQRLAQALRQQASFQAVTAGLGALAHLVLDYNFPASGAKPAHAQAFAHFLASRLPRIPVVFYGGAEAVPFASRDALWSWLLGEGQRLAALEQALAEDFARVGGPGQWNLLDDRSTAFGVASVAFNRAMSQYVTLASWIWRQGGGLVVPFPGDGHSILVWKGDLKPREAPMSHLRVR